MIGIWGQDRNPEVQKRGENKRVRVTRWGNVARLAPFPGFKVFVPNSSRIRVFRNTDRIQSKASSQ